MQTRDLFHGTNGDNILKIIEQGLIRPNAEGKIFFSEHRFDSVLMYGPDTKRMTTFAVKLRVTLPPTALAQKEVMPGVSDALIVTTNAPIQVQVLELYIKEPHGSTVKIVTGVAEIKKRLAT